MSEKSLFNIFGMDYEVHQQIDKHHAADPHYLPSESIFRSSVQSFSICHTETRAPAGSFYCFPYVEKKKWTNTRLLRVSRPFVLEEGRLSNEVLYVLINEIFLLARRARVMSVEFEVYSDIQSDIFFPSTDTVINTFNSTEWVKYLQYYKFKKHSCRNCFELDLSAVEIDEPFDQRIGIRKIRSKNGEDQNNYFDLWRESGMLPYAFAKNDLWYPNVFGWPRLWYAELPYPLQREDYILFADVDGEPAGFVHWWPNVFPMVRTQGVNSIYTTPGEAEEFLSQVNEGKIFRLAVSPRASLPAKEIARALLQAALKTMKEKYRFDRCQVGNVPENSYPDGIVRGMGGKEVHQIFYMRH